MVKMREIIKELEVIYRVIISNKHDQKKIRLVMLRLENLLLKKKMNKEEVYEIINTLGNKINVFQDNYEQFETELEEEFSRKIINSNKETNIKDYQLYKRFLRLIKEESRLGQIKKGDKVLFIGSGPLPITAIILNKLKGCEIHCIEKVKNRAEISKRIIRRLGLQQKINVYNKKGESIKNDDYSIVIIALLAKPKDRILKEIFSKVNVGTKIICRTSEGIRQFFYEATNERLFDKYSEEGKVKAKGDQIITSALLVKH